MKFRTDFVTNSSSSSTLVVLVVKKNKDIIYEEFSNDGGGIVGGIYPTSLRDAINKSKSPIDLLEQISKDYYDDGLSNMGNMTQFTSLTNYDDISAVYIGENYSYDIDDHDYLLKYDLNKKKVYSNNDIGDDYDSDDFYGYDDDDDFFDESYTVGDIKFFKKSYKESLDKEFNELENIVKAKKASIDLENDIIKLIEVKDYDSYFIVNNSESSEIGIGAILVNKSNFVLKNIKVKFEFNEFFSATMPLRCLLPHEVFNIGTVSNNYTGDTKNNPFKRNGKVTIVSAEIATECSLEKKYVRDVEILTKDNNGRIVAKNHGKEYEELWFYACAFDNTCKLIGGSNAGFEDVVVNDDLETTIEFENLNQYDHLEFSIDSWFMEPTESNDAKIKEETIINKKEELKSVAKAEKGVEENKFIDSSSKIVTFGSYPRTMVIDESIISILNSLKESSKNNIVIYDSKCYIFKSDLPHLTTRKFVGEEHWYVFEPIKWLILDDSEGLLLITDEVIDGQYYSVSHRYESPIKDSNYKESLVRKWLNKDFYNMAFIDEEKKLILNTNVDNSSKTTKCVKGNRFVCSDTLDKVFLPSYQDLMNEKYGFIPKSNVKDLKRLGHVTDYAISQGVFPVNKDKCTIYFTRSPFDNNYAIDCLKILAVDESARLVTESASVSRLGVRPMIRIKK